MAEKAGNGAKKEADTERAAADSGEGAEPRIYLQKGENTADVNLFGATVVSWKCCGIERLFVSEKAILDKTKPIRGGIPFIFPHFGPWEDGPQHGFARITDWNLASYDYIGSDTLIFTLEDNEETRKMWNHKFRIVYTITLNDTSLHLKVRITNKGDKDLPFHLLFHTYFATSDINEVKIEGLKQCKYVDKALDGKICTENRKYAIVETFTDRVYMKTPEVVMVYGLAAGKGIKIAKSNLPDLVVWNPWQGKAVNMKDFGNDEWRTMICVEAGSVTDKVVVKETESFEAALLLMA